MISENKIKQFLETVDNSFETKLSSKEDLNVLAKKFIKYATLCYEERENKIISLVAGYTENLINNLAYISVVATLPEFAHKGLATKLIAEFINICRKKEIKAVHLYASKYGLPIYKKFGFIKYEDKNEQRPNDTHLILHL